MRDLGEIGFNRNQDQILNYKFFSFLFLQQKRNKMPPLHLMLFKLVLWHGLCVPHQLRRKKG